MNISEQRRRSRSATEANQHAPRFVHPLGHADPPVQPSSASALDNVFQQFHLGLASGSIALKIPETLLVSEEGLDVLLHNNDSGSIQLYQGANPLQQFFSLSSVQFALENGRQEFPLYIFSTGDTRKALWSPMQAQKAWTLSRDHRKLLQRYVLPKGKEPSKVRVVWQKGQVRRYRIKKQGIENLLSRLRVQQRTSLKSNLLELPAPSTERRSVLEIARAQMTSDYEWEELSVLLIPAERFHIVLLEVLSRFLREEESIQELAYDVMQDSQGNLVFLNARWAQIGRPHNSATNLRAKFNSLMAAKVHGAIPFVDLKEIQAQNVQLYLSRFSNVAGEKQQACPSAEKTALEQTSSKLDHLVHLASASKERDAEQHRVRLESYHNDQMLECIVSRVYSKVLSEPCLQPYFSSMSKRELNMVKFGFVKAFTGVDNYYFKRTVKRVHEGLGIDRTQFTRFVELFVQAMQEEGVRTADVETVSRHLNRFSDEIIEDDST